MDKEYSVMINGEAVVFEFKDSLIHCEGEFAGNIDAVITTKPPLPQNLLLDELHIKIPGTNEFLYIYGYGAVENSLKATFNSSSHVDSQNLPDMVEVYWGANGEQFIGDMCCQKFSEEAEANITIEDEPVEEVATGNNESDKNAVEETASTESKTNNKLFVIIGAAILLLVIVCFTFL